MEKRRRSVASPSADEILSSATSLAATKPGKASLKSLIFSLPASSGLFSSLPAALHIAVSRSVDAFKKSLSLSADSSAPQRSSRSPPLKRSRQASTCAAAAEPGVFDAPLSPETLEHLKNLKAYAFVAYLCLSHPKKLFASSDLLPSVQSLHDSLVLYEMDPVLLSQVSTICEEWWKTKLPERENLVSQSLPFLLSKSLTEGKKADVRRVYTLKEAFLLFDYMDESIEDIRMLLIRCVITPVYLKMEEGRKFVAFMLGLSGQLMKEALALIKSQIPFGRKSVLEAYADILFRAWKASEGSLREEIEDDFLQGLIEGAVYASSKLLSASVRRILGGFIQQRMIDGVEKLLLRLVEPVLFRSLQVANSNVRQNALHLLLDMFPLEDPGVTKEVKDSLLNKQFFLLEKLLLDDCPEIRSVAVEGSCRILHLFWEVIPSPTITKFLSKIVDSMSHDMCNEVRISSINGIIYLLDNPQSHEIIKVLLPRLGFLLFDPVLSVRVAVVDLLLAVHGTHTIQFNKVVGLDDLLSTLANDHPRVARKITKLLLPSYFPSKLAIKEACCRIVVLIKRSPDAGARFCEFAFLEGSSSKSLMELAKVCISLALSSKGLSVEQIDGLLIASSNICQFLSNESRVKPALSDFLSAERLKNMFTAVSSERAQTAILTTASFASTNALAGLQEKCMIIVRNYTDLSDNTERQGVVKAAHKLMFACGWFDKMLEELANILQESASNFCVRFGLGSRQHTLKTSNKKKARSAAKTSARVGGGTRKESQSSDTSGDDKDFVVSAAAAWQVKSLLATEITRPAVLKSPISGMIFSALGVISEVYIQQCMQLKVLDIEPILAYTTLALFMSIQNDELTSENDICGLKDSKSQTKSSSPEEILDHAFNHIVNTCHKLFPESASGKPNQHLNFEVEVAHQQQCKHKKGQKDPAKSSEGCQDSSFNFKSTENMVKTYSTILKFFADAVATRLTDQNYTRCLKFASDHVRHVVSVLRNRKLQQSSTQEEVLKSSQEDVLKDIIIYLKSSFSYAAKLLHLVLKSYNESSAPPPEVFYLANDLLDLITAVELFMGSRHASSVVTVAKPWLPILLLGLGFNQLVTPDEESSLDLVELISANFPLWFSVLGKSQLDADDDDNQTPKLEVPVFENLIEKLLTLLKKGSQRILDAVGDVILAGLDVALQNADFGLVLGVVHFTCNKMLGIRSGPLEELKLFHSSLRKVHQMIDKELSDTRIRRDARYKLESAKSLIQSVL